MDPMSEEQLDYGEEDYGGSQKYPFAGGGGGTGGAIPALADEELMGEDDEYDDLYNDVNVGEGFIQTIQQQQQQQQQAPPARSEPTAPAVAFGNGNQNPDKHGSAGVEVKDSKPEQKPAQMGNMEFQGGPLASIPPKMAIDPNFGGGAPSVAAVAPPPPLLPPSVPLNPAGPGVVGSRPPMVNDNARQVMPPVDNSGPTMLFVGELHWWTTDAELESVMSQYGRVKEIKFFDERASGKSKGYCQVEFYESLAAAACKEGMNGYPFNGKPCVVTFASPQTLKQMASGYMNKNQGQGQTQMQGRRGMNDGVGRGGGMGFQGGDGGRNFGRGGWGGRGGQGMLNRGQGGGGPMRGRGLMGGKGMVGAAGVVGGAAGGPYGQGLAGPGLAGPAGGMMHPQSMMGAGFDPTFMGRGGPYAGFAAPGFPGMMPSFQAVNAVGLPGVAPHVNPAFFGRGMSANGMGMMGGGSGMDGQTMGMWGDANMGGWTGEEHGRRTRESSYGGDDVGSEYGYGEVNHERGGRSNASREKERGSERDWSGNSERRNRDEREQDWDRSDRDRYKEEKDPYRDHRHRDRDRDNDDDWDRGQSSSRSRSKSRMMQEEDYRSRSRDADYGKRRRGSE